MPTKKSSVVLSIMIFIGTLSLGFSSVAQAELKWVESMRGFCPDVCQNTKNHKFAVPSGIHKKSGKKYYICAVNYSMADLGWRTGYNIAWDKQSCFAQWHKTNSGKNSYQEHYLCLCSTQNIPPIEGYTGYIKRRR